MGGSFKGVVTVNQTSNTNNADITIAKIYQENSGIYQEINSMPTSGYILNSEKSTCTNNATPTWNETTNNVLVTNLTTSGTECTLYFDKNATASETILANITVNNGTPDFNQVATTDEGVFATEDGMYGGTSYYWRGAVTNNYVTFGGFCWRIVRINGDGSIRLIYDGTTCHANGTSTTDSIAVTSQAYDSHSYYSYYVGWSYTASSQHGTGTASNARNQVESWYSMNLTSYADYIADGKYCNDREVGSGTWSNTGSFYYATYIRLDTSKAPTLNCTNTSDVFTVKIGLITADEVAYAGGVVGSANQGYYLYNGQLYWTMSPYSMPGSMLIPRMFYIFQSGYLAWNEVTDKNGLRPVVNLNSDVTFSSGDGTINTPYIVKGTA